MNKELTLKEKWERDSDDYASLYKKKREERQKEKSGEGEKKK